MPGPQSLQFSRWRIKGSRRPTCSLISVPYAKQAETCSPPLSSRPRGRVLMVDGTFRGWMARPATQPSSVGVDPMQTQCRQSSPRSPARDQEPPASQGNVPKFFDGVPRTVAICCSYSALLESRRRRSLRLLVAGASKDEDLPASLPAVTDFLSVPGRSISILLTASVVLLGTAA